MRNLLFLSSLLLVLVAGCIAEAPDWTRGQSSSYPSVDYLTAVGVSPDRHTAGEKARQEVQSKFSWPQEVPGGEMKGVRVAEVWHDKNLQSYYALAVIDRHSAGKRLIETFAALEQNISGQVVAAEKAGSTLRRWGHFQNAVALASMCPELVKTLRSIDPVAVLPATAYSLQQLVEYREQAAAGVGVDIRLRNDRGDVVKRGLIRAFAERGIRLSPDFAADLHIRGSVERVASPSGLPAVAARIEIADTGEGAVPFQVIDELADLQTIGERLVFQIIAAVSSQADQK